MGAQVAADAGVKVVMTDVSDEAIANGSVRLARFLPWARLAPPGGRQGFLWLNGDERG